MGRLLPVLFFVLISVMSTIQLSTAQQISQNPAFDKNYQITWGNDHVSFLDKGTVQLSLDQYTGSGFGSRQKFGSGFFNMSIKLPKAEYTGGLVIAFYLRSGDVKHDEVDFEFLGHKIGEPYQLSTNVFAGGVGGREQRIKLWYDAAANFHTYKILWNPHQIVFYIDDTPIRVYKNRTDLGATYPNQPMQLIVSLWNGDNWATDGGRAKINYTYAPYTSQFRKFNINGCPVKAGRANNSARIQSCFSTSSNSTYWWNREPFWELTPAQKAAYEGVKKSKFLMYDYCQDRARYPTPPPEC